MQDSQSGFVSDAVMADPTRSEKGASEDAAASDTAAVKTITFGDGFRSMSDGGFTVLIILLCLPFIQPISLGPLATVAGFSLAALGWQMARGRSSPWLPARLERVAVPVASWGRLVKASNSLLAWVGRISSPRLSSVVGPRHGMVVAGVLVSAAGLLMAVPFIGIPLNNTFPALMALCAVIATIKGDGVLVIASILWFLITVVYFAFIIYALIFLGTEFLSIDAVTSFLESVW